MSLGTTWTPPARPKTLLAGLLALVGGVAVINVGAATEVVNVAANAIHVETEAHAVSGVITRQEIVLGVMGAVFVAEVLSVMLQVGWFKYTRKRFGVGRRIFKMAPLHHHFEKSGWTETQVVIRFWIITMLLCLVVLASLKLR